MSQKINRSVNSRFIVIGLSSDTPRRKKGGYQLFSAKGTEIDTVTVLVSLLITSKPMALSVCSPAVLTSAFFLKKKRDVLT